MNGASLNRNVWFELPRFMHEAFHDLSHIEKGVPVTCLGGKVPENDMGYR